jgi:hypothetical protein
VVTWPPRVDWAIREILRRELWRSNWNDSRSGTPAVPNDPTGTEFRRGMANINSRIDGIQGRQRRLVVTHWEWARLVERRPRPLIRHAQEQQERELFNVVTIRVPIARNESQ